MAVGVHYIGTRTMATGGKPKIFFLGFGGNTTLFPDTKNKESKSLERIAS